MLWRGIQICCPSCKGELEQLRGSEERLHCGSCDRDFPVVLGIPDLRVFSDPYVDVETDHDKGRRVAERLDSTTFPELIEYYYSITSVVPPQHARLYTRGLLAGEARARSALEAWEGIVVTREAAPPGKRLLDLGCGTAPLMVAGASRYQLVVGLDIAFRWLVVAKKRLQEAGLDAPLICACAEALPFPNGTFDRVAGESVLEHVSGQREALAEAYRVTRPGGCLFMSTPNRYSLGPDPQAGIWAGGYLPDSWIAAYVRRQGGIPPKRKLLSARSLRRLIREAGYETPQVALPDIPEAQRRQFGGGLRVVIGLYQLAKRLPILGALLLRIGPLLIAVARKPLHSDA